MCGRYVCSFSIEGLIEQFGLDAATAFQPHYNIAPSAVVPIVRQSPQGKRVADLLRWGLIPNWSKDPAIGGKLNNARAESITEKPSFRNAYRQRRCLIPANGFYEWQEVAGEKKQPWYIHLKGDVPMAMGGLWESWIDPADEIVRTFCVVTTSANEVMQPIHERMPVIISASNWATWLNPKVGDVGAMLAPSDAAAMEAWPVSRRVSRASEEGEELILPVC
jgi:putative SOS response-associated peptidase YedK